ncbi:MAG: thioredoxin domain-containing protein [Phycisphaeraceae bacterium]|nr:thioredoxin domain-containing protein [Phycisphaeraceae bacterium]MCW5763744.1 thioredoxin domain-containing protein [Phycisphaeraceae bacterium]
MPNRLIDATSPYLLQHAHNPVDWYAWGDEAFAAARTRDCPIFLSVGYSTCYWCHVMERESFEDEATARLLNARFVAIKVDREERPDVDELYMLATQLMTGHGGWPMNVFLDPHSLKPFWCGTYFPPEPRHGMHSFTQVIEGMAIAWRDQRDTVIAQADRLAQSVADALSHHAGPISLSPTINETAVSHLLRQFDRTHGGFGGAPKFPQPAFLDFLLAARDHVAEDDTRSAIDLAVRTTLDRIALGGIHDHVGGGFHRYAVDATWTVPHFEKMLYDNALLAATYTQAARVYDDNFYRRTLRRTLDYVLREMTDPHSGAFSSAQDAEVDTREGLNYLWTPDEVRTVLGPDAEFALAVFGLDKGPNFKDPHHADAPAANVLRLAHRPEDLAAQMGLSLEDFLARLDRVSDALLAARGQRKQPHLDDKTIVAWNALMIRALATASVVLDEPRYLDAAIRASRFILASMRDPGGNLLRIHRAGTSHTPAFLEDHAAMIRALVALHDAAPDTDLGGSSPLEAALDLADRAHTLFSDEHGSFFDAPAGATDLFIRPRSTYDGAIPSGCSLMLAALVDLAAHTTRTDIPHRAAALLASLSSQIAASPTSTVLATQTLLRIMLMPTIRDLLPEDDAAPRPDQYPGQQTAQPVSVFADVDAVTVAPGEPAVFHVELRIAPGYHIIAADPGRSDMALSPLRVGLTRGQGVAVYADYPTGEPLETDPALLVHHDLVSFAVALEHAPGVGASAGKPVLGVSFQACSSEACLAPAAVALEIDITIDITTTD